MSSSPMATPKVDGEPCAVLNDINGNEGEQGIAETSNETITIKVHVGRSHVFPLTLRLADDVGQLKMAIEAESGVPVLLQKLMYKSSQLRNDKTSILDAKLVKNAKLLVLGCPPDMLKQACTKPTPAEITQSQSSSSTPSEPLCRLPVHKKVIAHGVPDDATVGINNSAEALPGVPLVGMRNSRNQTVRLTFKMEQDQLWIGTAANTQKVNMGSINDISSEPIEGHEQYHIMGLKMGSTEQSRYWIYWVPAQYVQAIKHMILQ